ncbi:MAG: aminodeoxychorismate synthase component I [Ignavibacteriales bacterium]|nr:aminodeoxychorismate synthase component I [Ignavibacteriales bacterium]
MNRSDAIQTMNRLGKNNVPFLFIIDYEMRNPQILKLDDIDETKILYDINGIHNDFVKPILQKNISFAKKPVSHKKYMRAFNNIQKHIGAGNTYLLNLTFPTEIKVNLTLLEIFLHSEAKYKLFFKNKFVVFSPERFIQISDGRISSNPMKGTIDASILNAKNIILNDIKEQAEHNTIVDLIRNDLSMIAKNVRVEKFRYIDKIKTHNKNLFQVSSKIVGELDRNYKSKIGDIIFALLPAGSISGAPKKKTIQIIYGTENYKRGYYTGVFGYFDGDYLDSGVIIRFIERNKNKFIYKSGGGITSLSNPKLEYNEMVDKIYVPIV